MRESRGLSCTTRGERREWRHRFTHANSTDEKAERIDVDRDDSVCEHVEEFQRALAIRFHLFARTTEAATKTTASRLKCSIRNLRAARRCDSGGQRIARAPRDEIRAFKPRVLIGTLDARGESFADSTRAIGWQCRPISRERHASIERLRKEHKPRGVRVSTLARLGRRLQIRVKKRRRVGARQHKNGERSFGRRAREVCDERTVLIKIRANAKLRLQEVDRSSHREDASLTRRLNELLKIVACLLEIRNNNERNRALGNPAKRPLKVGRYRRVGWRKARRSGPDQCGRKKR